LAAGQFDVTLPTDVIVPSSTNSPAAQRAGKAIDDTAATKYLNLDEQNTGFTVSATITNQRVTALTLISAEDVPARDPSSFSVEGSVDGTNFTLLGSQAVPAFVARNSIQSFRFANYLAYPVYRVTFGDVQDPAGANSMQIAEVELLPYGDITTTNDPVSIVLPPGAVDVRGVGKLFNRQLGALEKLEISTIPPGSPYWRAPCASRMSNTRVALSSSTPATAIENRCTFGTVHHGIRFGCAALVTYRRSHGRGARSHTKCIVPRRGLRARRSCERARVRGRVDGRRVARPLRQRAVLRDRRAHCGGVNRASRS
jgi:hypothetical protein